jgi:hypothetical protein
MYDYLMNTASALFFLCYVPEFYANYKNKNANMYNFPEKVVVFLGSTFAFTYAAFNHDMVLMTNYGSLLGLDVIALLMRAYYAYKNKSSSVESTPPSPHSQIET